MFCCVRHTPRYITQCVRHTPPVTHRAISRSVQSYMCKTITECPPREARGVLLAKHGVSARLYHAATDITVCPSHTTQCRNVSVTNCVISRGVSVTLRHVMLRCVRHTPRYITRCVRHTPPVAHRAISRDVQSYTRKTITECPPREARGVLLAKHGVSAHLIMQRPISRCVRHTAQCRNVSVTDRAISRGVSITQRVTDITRPMCCMPPLYFLQHSTYASPSLSYNLINKPASYHS